MMSEASLPAFVGASETTRSPGLIPFWSADVVSVSRFTCVPVGSGSRVAIDRDGDGYADWAEIVRLRDPADPNSHP